MDVGALISSLSLFLQYLSDTKGEERNANEDTIRHYLEWLRRKDHQQLVGLLEAHGGTLDGIAREFGDLDQKLSGLSGQLEEVVRGLPRADFELMLQGTSVYSRLKTEREVWLTNLSPHGLRVTQGSFEYWLEDNPSVVAKKDLTWRDAVPGNQTARKNVGLDQQELHELTQGRLNHRETRIHGRLTVVCKDSEQREIKRTCEGVVWPVSS